MATRKLRLPEAPDADDRPSAPGRVVFDGRGNPVWEWNTSAGDSTSVLLKQLENEDLALEPTRSFRTIVEPSRAEPSRTAPRTGKRSAKDEPFELADHGGKKGFDPYNRS